MGRPATEPRQAHPGGRRTGRARVGGQAVEGPPGGIGAVVLAEAQQHSIVHAAADAVDAGRLDADAAADVLEATLLPVLLPPPNAPGPARDAG